MGDIVVFASNDPDCPERLVVILKSIALPYFCWLAGLAEAAPSHDLRLRGGRTTAQQTKPSKP